MSSATFLLYCNSNEPPKLEQDHQSEDNKLFSPVFTVSSLHFTMLRPTQLLAWPGSLWRACLPVQLGRTTRVRCITHWLRSRRPRLLVILSLALLKRLPPFGAAHRSKHGEEERVHHLHNSPGPVLQSHPCKHGTTDRPLRARCLRLRLRWLWFGCRQHSLRGALKDKDANAWAGQECVRTEEYEYVRSADVLDDTGNHHGRDPHMPSSASPHTTPGLDAPRRHVACQSV
jgi:hypothetical protein